MDGFWEAGAGLDLFLGWEGAAKEECRRWSGLHEVDTLPGGLTGG